MIVIELYVCVIFLIINWNFIVYEYYLYNYIMYVLLCWFVVYILKILRNKFDGFYL